MFTAGLCWARRLLYFGDRRLRPQSLDRLSGLRLVRRHRPRSRLHFAGLDADQMVSRPAGHGDRHGDHGLRRRRFHRLAAVGVADAASSPHQPMSASPKPSSCSGVIYFFFMMVGAAIVRVPAPGWKPEGYTPPVQTSEADHDERRLSSMTRCKTPQFWLIWWVLCLNVTAGIGVLGQASAMSQEMFPGKVTADRGGGLRRTAEPVQHAGPLLLGLDLRLYRAQEHLLLLLRARHGALRAGAVDRRRSAASRCSCCASW